MKKRLLSWLLILALCLSLLPAAALAEDAPEQTEAPVVREQTEAPTVQEQAESVRAVNDTAAQATFTITAETLLHVKHTLTVSSTDTILSVKQQLVGKVGYPVEQIQLMHAGAYLNNSKTLADYSIPSGANLTLILTLAHKSHPICGAAHTDIGDHTGECANVTWTAWNGVDAIPYDSNNTAYVYLSGDAERTEILTVAAGYKLYLCLNGYSLTKTTEDSNPSFKGVITIYQGAQFTLCDCRGGGKITHAEGMLGRGVRCGDSSSGSRATFAMFGGEISGNHVGSTSGTGQDGAGVEVHNAIFNMYGGRIADNHVEKVSNDGGGGVYAHDSGSFTMYGGEISGNTSAGDGGGVSVVAASFTMKGGSITNNTASAGDGGGAALYNGTFELSGGTITGNRATRNGGGVYYYHYQSDPLTVSGSVTITGNRNASGADNNVYLSSGVYMIVTGELKNVIGVTTESVPSASNAVMIAANGGYMTEAMKDHFVYDLAGDCKSVYDSTRRAIYLKVIPHEHPICGATHTDINGHTGECSNVKWTAWNGVSDITYGENNTAYVYLTTNAERTSTLEIAQGNTLYLCLNGKSLTMNKGLKSVISVVSGATLSLCDCSDAQSGKLTHGTKTDGSKIGGRGVTVQGTFDMYGGSITGNDTAAAGGGVSLPYESYSARFNLYGGSITNNTANNGGNDGGGGVHILSGKFTMYGGSITGNHADRANFGGGGVYLGNTVGKFHMKGGSITDNTAKNGGGVYMYANGVSVSGSVNITGNKNADGKDENVYLNSNVYFYINTDGLNADSEIGVTAANDIASGKYVTAAYCADRSYTEGSIFSDKPEYDTLRWQDYVRLYNGLPHVHPDCGDKTCTNNFHTNNSMWTPVSTEAELNAIAAKGSCYLANDIELSSTYTPKDGVHLCLNGYSLIAKGNFDVITLTDGDGPNRLSLDVCDCNASGNGKGTITHASGAKGRGVFVGTGTNFKLYGGSITGNHVEGSGGGIYAKGVNFVDMSTGASITGNTATGNGGGVMLTGSYFNNGNGYGSAHFCTESSGGTISGNTAKGYGGGVYISGLDAGSSFAPRNVTVTGNKAAKGGGVYVSSTGRLSVRNGAYITGNESAEGAADNVYLTDGKTIGFWSALTEGATVGVTTEKKLANGGYAVIADGNGNNPVTLTETDRNSFTSDAGYGTLLKDNKIFFTTGALHEHGICGASCDHETTHGDELWQPLTYDAATMTLYCGGEAVKSSDYPILAGVDDTYIYYMEYQLPAGNYYLADNIALNGGTANGKTYVGGIIRTKGYDLNVNLCLNGFTLSAPNPNTPLLSVARLQTLTLSDCKGGGKIQTDAGGYNVLQVFGDEGKGGTFTMYGGTLSGARTGVYTYNYGVVNLFGGTITGNECGLDIGGNGSVTVGGTVNITGNTKQNLYLYTGGKTTAIISIDTTLTKDSRIGISSALTKNGQSPIHVATGANSNVLNYNQIFTADAKSDGYVVVKDGAELQLKKHAHDWTYTANDETKTISATCSNADGNCPLGGDGGSVTLNAPTGTLTYTGTDQPATLENNLKTGDEAPTIIYTYERNGNSYSIENGGLPKNADTYTASITLGGQSVSVQYTIDPKPITVTVDAVSRAYGDANPAFTAAAPSGALVGSDTVASLGLTLTSTAIATSNVGTYHVTGTASNGNYAVTIYGTNKLTVTAKPITVTVDPATRAYGDENPAFTATAPSSALVGNDTVASLNLTLSSDATATSPVGKYDVTGTANNGNYAVTVKGTDALAVTQRAVTLTVNAASRIYGDANPDFTAELTGGTYAPGDSFQSLGLSLTTAADTTSPVGSYNVTGSASNTNYNVTVLGEKKLTITQRPITVEVDAVSRTYGERNPNFTANTVKSGSLVKGDMLVLTLTTTADRTSPVGKYDVTLKLSDSPNYAVTVEGKDKLTVTAKPITVTVDPATRAYGDENPAFTATVPSGALVGDDTVESLNLTLSSDATATSPVGKYDVTGTANNANYTVTVEGTNVLTVEPKTITVTAENKSSRVGYELVELTYTYTPALLDGAAFNGKLATNANKDVVGDQYTITQGTLELNANYAIVFNAGKYTVTSKLTQDSFAFADSTIQKTYGDPNFLVAATGVETGSNVTYALDPSSDSSIAEVAADGTVTIKKTGTVTITATAAATRDYDEATASCTLIIDPAKLTVTALDKKITVYESAPDLSNPVEGEDYTVTGTLFGADTLTAVTMRYSETPDTSKVGEYIINITATLANYDITTVPGTLTIEPSKSTQRLGILDGARTVPGGTIGTSPKNALPGQTVTITVTPQKGYELGGLTVRDIAGGQLTLTRESDREYTFVMPDSSVSVTGYFVREGETMFRDVPADAYYYEAVQWAVETGVTGGVGDDLFAPDAACTRAQIVTFLWRAAGSPEPQSKADFTDVPANAYYAKAVAWALENGITKGTSATTFSPDDPCTRAQAVTFLARALSAKAEGTADFFDVAESAYYCGAVAWAAENDVTSGVGGKRFAPDQTCTRAQIVTFLYRAYNK